MNGTCERCGRLTNSPKVCKLCHRAKLGENIRKAQAVRTKYARLPLSKRYDGRCARTSKRRIQPEI